ncbi:hypothetical protein BHE74_00055984 [Ensete ventricosum]|nr:hypothetical protein BHE74_00055984 [Ensete ventricosum]
MYSPTDNQECGKDPIFVEAGWESESEDRDEGGLLLSGGMPIVDSESLRRSIREKWKKVWTKRALMGLVLGQFVSLLITSTGFSSSELARRGPSLAFFSLFFRFGCLLFRRFVRRNAVPYSLAAVAFPLIALICSQRKEQLAL